jgi:hypothetical protein
MADFIILAVYIVGLLKSSVTLSEEFASATDIEKLGKIFRYKKIHFRFHY